MDDATKLRVKNIVMTVPKRAFGSRRNTPALAVLLFSAGMILSAAGIVSSVFFFKTNSLLGVISFILFLALGLFILPFALFTYLDHFVLLVRLHRVLRRVLPRVDFLYPKAQPLDAKLIEAQLLMIQPLEIYIPPADHGRWESKDIYFAASELMEAMGYKGQSGYEIL